MTGGKQDTTNYLQRVLAKARTANVSVTPFSQGAVPTIAQAGGACAGFLADQKDPENMLAQQKKYEQLVAERKSILSLEQTETLAEFVTGAQEIRAEFVTPSELSEKVKAEAAAGNHAKFIGTTHVGTHGLHAFMLEVGQYKRCKYKNANIGTVEGNCWDMSTFLDSIAHDSRHPMRGTSVVRVSENNLHLPEAAIDQLTNRKPGKYSV